MGESGAHCSEESRSNGHDEREGRGDLDMPIDELESLHRLSKAELRNEEGPISSPVHRLNPGPTGRIKLLLLFGRIFGLQPDCNSFQRSREDDVHFGTFAFRRIPFGLCNAPPTFQRCMMAIFSDFLGDSLEVFMDEFNIFGNDFERCLAHLTKILEVCVRKRLVLSWEKSHFMVRDGVVLGH